jgi:hypothetical protein
MFCFFSAMVADTVLFIFAGLLGLGCEHANARAKGFHTYIYIHFISFHFFFVIPGLMMGFLQGSNLRSNARTHGLEGNNLGAIFCSSVFCVFGRDWVSRIL